MQPADFVGRVPDLLQLEEQIVGVSIRLAAALVPLVAEHGGDPLSAPLRPMTLLSPAASSTVNQLKSFAASISPVWADLPMLDEQKTE